MTYPNYLEKKISKYIAKLQSINPFKRKAFDQGIMATSALEVLNGYFQKTKIFDLLQAFNFFKQQTMSILLRLYKYNEEPTKIIEKITKKADFYRIIISEDPNCYYVLSGLKQIEMINTVIIYDGNQAACDCNEALRYGIVCSHILAVKNFNNSLEIDTKFKKESYFTKLDEKEFEVFKSKDINILNIEPMDIEIPTRVRRDCQKRNRIPSEFEYNGNKK
ncbi:SWIM zinc finger family protein [Trichomonas vaginalis G3]|uniref:SWIM zinc finger family protein n=1 Tax=Trichomonas vaginalis (strain ATCC PRA-98 / G3) TaxID=412133 RepID=A2EYX1_TRIV3|nr:SWIM zinc finger family [Trichomonas vaginalis G3]EAY02133.1 SWIM zinc finger family protein [Trichomonas vaginalis G3]KAI5547401.1 SWIM zinc finger family [Trichomonas vaginalis G3]|eukprot:XP_001314512.1 SWIM zinc finger family protein [Trichomonas vaginalis G3]